jgi:hypothetical protein
MQCGQNYMVSGFRAVGTPANGTWIAGGDYIRDLTVECGPVVGRDGLGHYLVGGGRTWAQGSSRSLGSPTPLFTSRCDDYGATALSLGVHYGDSLIQAFSMFCGGPVTKRIVSAVTGCALKSALFCNP